MCVFSRKATLLLFLANCFFFFDLKNAPLFPQVLKCGVIETVQVIIIETSIEKIYVLNGSFKSLALCPRMVKDD